jgi:hypothetical protein
MTDIERQVLHMKSDYELLHGYVVLGLRRATPSEISEELDRRRKLREYSAQQRARGES